MAVLSRVVIKGTITRIYKLEPMLSRGLYAKNVADCKERSATFYVFCLFVSV